MKNFIDFGDAVQYAKEMRLNGYGAYIEDNGNYFSVFVWKN